MGSTGGQRQTIVVGRWGAVTDPQPNKDWDDGGSYTGIREIHLEHNKQTAIGSFQVVYDVNGTPFEAKNHPSFITDFTKEKIVFDYPTEYIVEVSGYTGKVKGYELYTVIRSLTFKTNKKTYGPYGVEEGTPFNLPIENGLLVGFKGTTGYWLDFIAFHLSL